jgi:hypothetical protein
MQHGHMNVLSRCKVTWTYCHVAARSHERNVTMQHGHMNVMLRCSTVTWTYYHEVRSHERTVTMHGHMNVLSRCTITWTYCYDARSHELIVTMQHDHMNVLLRCSTVTWTYCYDAARSHERIVTMQHGRMNAKIKWLCKFSAACRHWCSTGVSGCAALHTAVCCGTHLGAERLFCTTFDIPLQLEQTDFCLSNFSSIRKWCEWEGRRTWWTS